MSVNPKPHPEPVTPPSRTPSGDGGQPAPLTPAYCEHGYLEGRCLINTCSWAPRVRPAMICMFCRAPIRLDQVFGGTRWVHERSEIPLCRSVATPGRETLHHGPTMRERFDADDWWESLPPYRAVAIHKAATGDAEGTP